MRTAFANNLKWILFMVSGTVLLGLLIATLADRVRYEALAKAIIFMPMAISFVGAGVIWKFVYDYGSSQVQIGLLNALITALGGRPVSWLTEPQINTLALIVVGIWMWTGFCMTVLSAAIKGVPTELLEAARVDGANEWTVFWKIRVPLILPTIAVVITTMIINVLKIFDLVYVMTGGNYGTEVIAYRLYIEMYTSYNTGRAAAIAWYSRWSSSRPSFSTFAAFGHRRRCDDPGTLQTLAGKFARACGLIGLVLHLALAYAGLVGDLVPSLSGCERNRVVAGL